MLRKWRSLYHWLMWAWYEWFYIDLQSEAEKRNRCLQKYIYHMCQYYEAKERELDKQ